MPRPTGDRRTPGAAVPIALPTPLPVGTVNCWVLPGEPLTLVDAGPMVAESAATLETGLRSLGLRLEDVELLLLTHQHVDHIGNAAAIVERSGCRVAAHELLSGFARDPRGGAAAEAHYQDAVMRLHGTPGARRDAFWEDVSDRQGYWGPGVEVDVVLGEGDVVEAGSRLLRASHRPGHSPSDTIFVDESCGSAIVADHLLRHISSNPLVSRPLSGPADPRRRRSSVRTYLDSLARTADEDLAELLTGHGRPITGHRALIEERVRLHHRRVEQVAGVLGDRTCAAFELTEELWPGIALNQTYLTVCEVLGALDLLVEEGRVQAFDDGAIVRYARV